MFLREILSFHLEFAEKLIFNYNYPQALLELYT